MGEEVLKLTLRGGSVKTNMRGGGTGIARNNPFLNKELVWKIDIRSPESLKQMALFNIL